MEDPMKNQGADSHLGPAALAGMTALLALLALAAQAAPAQWSGASGGVWVRLFVDGQKATGGVEATVPWGTARMELSGSGAGTTYGGTLQGTGWTQGRTVP